MDIDHYDNASHEHNVVWLSPPQEAILHAAEKLSSIDPYEVAEECANLSIDYIADTFLVLHGYGLIDTSMFRGELRDEGQND